MENQQSDQPLQNSSNPPDGPVLDQQPTNLSVDQGGTMPKKSPAKFILAGVVVLISIGLLAYVIAGKSSNKQGVNIKSQTMNTPKLSPTLPANVESTEDIQLDKDTKTIDSDLKKLETDISNADEGLNDHPEDLSQ